MVYILLSTQSLFLPLMSAEGLGDYRFHITDIYLSNLGNWKKKKPVLKIIVLDERVIVISPSNLK